LPDSKVALFIDFDNIRIGIRQHFGGELHPQKLMSKASKYGRVTTAKAYADFTGHPKEFQDRLLFAAGIEPIHAPSKLSGGRRQSSADMHMVIDMFLEAIDHQDVDTFVLMTGDADFVRMVATLRRRFGRKVIVSGVQSTSTSLDLMNAADARDSITRQDVDMTGELGRLTRPLVTRADLDAQAAEEANRPKRGGILRGLFGRKPEPASKPSLPAPTPPVVAPAPRRMRASELRGSGTAPQRGGRTPRTAPAGAASTPAARPGRGQQREFAPVGPDTRPDEVEQRIVKEIFMMPPGRAGYNTMKTIEEVLRSKAGEMGSTRKEVPVRLQRLEEMGLFRRVQRQRGSSQVETGELAFDHPIVGSLTSGMRRPEAPARREPGPRRARGSAVTAAAEAAAEAVEGAPVDLPSEPEAETAAFVAAEPTPEAPVEEVLAAPAVVEPAQSFRWVTPPSPAPDGPPVAETKAKKPAARRSTRKATSSKPRAPRSRKPVTKVEPAAPSSEEAGGATEIEPVQYGTEG
jgi:uncharacterized LabA/DUF88 family protein